MRMLVMMKCRWLIFDMSTLVTGVFSKVEATFDDVGGDEKYIGG